MTSTSLSDAKLRGLKPKPHPYKVADRDGLYVAVSTNGGRSFRYNYRIGGRQKTLTYGSYPHLSLEHARRAHREAQATILGGQIPVAPKQLAKAKALSSMGSTVSEFAQRWYDNKRAPKKAPQTLAKDRIFLNDVRQAFGDVPLQDVTNGMILGLLRAKLAAGQRNWPGRIRQKLSSLYRFAQSEGLECLNRADVVKDAIELDFSYRNHPFLKDRTRMGQLLRDSEAYTGSLRVRVALCFLPHVFVRPGELRFAVWDEFDFDNSLWRIPASRMKMKVEHLVPLSPQSIALLKLLEPLKVESRYLFQGETHKEQPFSENTLNQALRRMGYGADEIVSHGFRGFASTNLNEQGYDWHHIEMQLSHRVGNAVSLAYNKAAYLEQRTKMMSEWSNFLDSLKQMNPTSDPTQLVAP